MRVLLISHIFPPAIDGGSKVVHKIGQHFESNNYEVLYISSNCRSTDDFVNPHSKTIALSQKNHIYLPVYKNLKKIFKLIYILTKNDLFLILAKGPVFKIIPSIKIINKIKKFNPEVIISGPLPTTIIIYSTLLKKLLFPKSKLIINASFHESDPDFHRHQLIKSLQSADLIWTLTKHETNTLTNNYKIKNKQIILLGNGVNSQMLITKATNYISKNILFIGSFAAHKNIETLIKAFSLLKSSNPKATLTLAGQKTLYFPTIQEIISKQSTNVKNSIEIIFEPSNKKLLKLIDKCQLLVQPSHQESFGLTIIEANARKKPVIVSDIASMSEIISNTNSGLVFHVNSDSNLAQKIEELINDPKKCQKLGENGYNYVSSHYTWDKIGNKLESAILTL